MVNATTITDRKETRRIGTLREGVTVTQFVDQMLQTALGYRASDIHFQPLGKELLVRIRVDGLMGDLCLLSKDLEGKVVNHLKTKANIDISHWMIPSDGRFAYEFEAVSYDFRVNSTPILENGEWRQRVVIRILDHRSVETPLPELGLLPNCEEMIKRALYRKRGLILSTGPTGSGKTTLLYVVVNGIANPTLNVLGVGDPPEYAITGVSQGAATPACSFADYVRSFLRQDPDVIMVAEIRDPATAEVVTNAAVLGRLVLSSLHTNNAALAPYRLNCLGVDQSLIAEAMNLVINQRLVRRLCPDCRIRRIVPTPQWGIDLTEIQRGAAAVGAQYSDCDSMIETYAPGGAKDGAECERCAGSGYIGRVGLFEILEAYRLADAMRHSISPGYLSCKAIEEDAIWPMAADAMAKVFEGIITLDDAKTVCVC